MSFTDKELMYACRIAYADLYAGFDMLVTRGKNGPVLIGDILDVLRGNESYDMTSLTELDGEGLDLIREWKLVDYHNDNEGIAESGYYGCLIETGSGKVVAASRGSESFHDIKNRIADWVMADLMLLTSELTAQQAQCAAFAEKIAYSDYIYKYDEMAVTGHSLGGNLAQHFAIVSYQYGLNKLITKSVNFDGPGFSEEYYSVKEHQKGIKLMRDVMYNYAWSFIGCLLTHYGKVIDIDVDKEGKNFLTVHKLDSIVFADGYVKEGNVGAAEKYIGEMSRRIDKKPDYVGYGVFVLLSTLLMTGYWLTDYMFDSDGELTPAGYLIIISLLVCFSPFIGYAESIALVVFGVIQLTKVPLDNPDYIDDMFKHFCTALGDIYKWSKEFSGKVSKASLSIVSEMISVRLNL